MNKKACARATRQPQFFDPSAVVEDRESPALGQNSLGGTPGPAILPPALMVSTCQLQREKGKSKWISEEGQCLSVSVFYKISPCLASWTEACILVPLLSLTNVWTGSRRPSLVSSIIKWTNDFHSREPLQHWKAIIPVIVQLSRKRLKAKVADEMCVWVHVCWRSWWYKWIDQEKASLG